MSQPFLGEIRMFGFNFAPRGWLFCQGQLLSIAQNTALFSLLGTTYGGDGRTTFGLPDLRGRAPVGQGSGPGLSNIQLGELSGVENITLLQSQLPPHNHPTTVALRGTSASASVGTPDNVYLATNDNIALYRGGSPTLDLALNANTAVATVGLTGSGLPVSIRNPYLGLNFCIAVTGIFPSRN